MLYQHLLKSRDSTREMWLAMPDEAYISVLSDFAGIELLKEVGVKLFTINLDSQEIVRWLK